ncbi:hypothetical protein LEP1GSC020_3650 [Leptospira interrogans serovar Grippotyphosa str. 2006006986]|nr:hypothetical protein LEP1GSC045_1253 [Leptospira interrogans serovar Pomona str. Kennewicki LC82-25]EKP86383.1 hypothetical protein LEP1GSC020_3650 [Leptospira interrogans serovar Grippotyphosa str. 2006006986]EMI62251.1 hypothetical protein LEP1GSC200_2864 [Leptospira interrogans serovar Pomona str. CSL10083]
MLSLNQPYDLKSIQSHLLICNIEFLFVSLKPENYHILPLVSNILISQTSLKKDR